MQVVTVPPQSSVPMRDISIPIHRSIPEEGRMAMGGDISSDAAQTAARERGRISIRTPRWRGGKDSNHRCRKFPKAPGQSRSTSKSAQISARTGFARWERAPEIGGKPRIKSKVQGCDRRCYSRSGLSKLRGADHAFKTSHRFVYRSTD